MATLVLVNRCEIGYSVVVLLMICLNDRRLRLSIVVWIPTLDSATAGILLILLSEILVRMSRCRGLIPRLLRCSVSVTEKYDERVVVVSLLGSAPLPGRLACVV